MSDFTRESARAARLLSTDVRAVSTQRLLVEALSRMVRTEGFDNASATRVAREAGLSRSGFYEHFASVDDLAFFMLDELLTQATAQDLHERTTNQPSPQGHPEFALHLLFETILSDRILYANILLSSRAGSIVSRLVERFAQSAQPAVQLARPESRPEQKDLFAAAIGGIALGVVMHCLRNNEERTAEDLTEDVVQVMPAWMYPSSQKSLKDF